MSGYGEVVGVASLSVLGLVNFWFSYSDSQILSQIGINAMWFYFRLIFLNNTATNLFWIQLKIYPLKLCDDNKSYKSVATDQMYVVNMQKSSIDWTHTYMK